MANMRDVSHLSGVSLSCVSRILSGDPHFHVREDTRRKVFDAARQLNYQYAHGRETPKKIGCVMSFTVEKYSDKYFLTIISAIEKTLQTAGCVLASLYTAGEIDSFGEQNQLAPLSGLVLFGDSIPSSKLEKIKRAVPRVVGVDTDFQGIDDVGHDNYRTGIQAMEHLLARGHRKIAYVGGEERVRQGRDGAYIDLMEQRGFHVPPGYHMDCGWEPDRCHDMVLQLCRREDRPTAIFAGSDNLAIAVLSAVQAAGLSTPGDVAVVGVNNLDFSAYTSPPLTTVSIPMEEIGTAAAQLLLRRVGGFSGLPVKVLYPTTLIVRDST